MRVMDAASVSASPAPADAVLPQAGQPGDSGFVGIVMLDTRFPRPAGDLGNPASWPVPVRPARVQGAWPEKVVATAAGLRGARLLPAFTAVVRQLERAGARAITTSCGFLVLLQRELQAAARVPVVTSSLLQLPALLAREPQVGVLTASARHLGKEHLRAAGVPAARLADVVVQGMPPGGEFARAVLGNQPELDLEAVRAEAVAAALALQARAPAVRTLVLECTNLPPYAQAIAAATGLALRDLRDAPGLAAPR